MNGTCAHLGQPAQHIEIIRFTLLPLIVIAYIPLCAKIRMYHSHQGLSLSSLVICSLAALCRVGYEMLQNRTTLFVCCEKKEPGRCASDLMEFFQFLASFLCASYCVHLYMRHYDGHWVIMSGHDERLFWNRSKYLVGGWLVVVLILTIAFVMVEIFARDVADEQGAAHVVFSVAVFLTAVQWVPQFIRLIRGRVLGALSVWFLVGQSIVTWGLMYENLVEKKDSYFPALCVDAGILTLLLFRALYQLWAEEMYGGTSLNSQLSHRLAGQREKRKSRKDTTPEAEVALNRDSNAYDDEWLT